MVQLEIDQLQIDNTIGNPENANKPRLVYNDFPNESVLRKLHHELKRCDTFEFSVAFITDNGIVPFCHILRNHPYIKGRIITTDYLSFNEPKALKKILELENVECRVYTKQPLHTKGYLFHSDGNDTLIIGSSNLTNNALTFNKEWNVRISSEDDDRYVIEQSLNEFEKMWNESDVLDESWLDDYKTRYKQPLEQKIEAIVQPYSTKIVPNSMQKEALMSLERIRNNKDSPSQRALIISATGTGKTFLSAFDIKQFNAKRVLFLVHREQILNSAIETFRRIFGEGISMGKITGHDKDEDAEFIFSTTQSMTKDDTLNKFAPDHFDYIVCDEAHHAVSPHYLKIINHFKPKFLLGMTATPERMDQKKDGSNNIFNLFDHIIAYEIRLKDALKADLLCPFHYYGISDITVDGNSLDEKSNFNSLTCDERVRHVMDQAEYYGHSGERVKGLIFCRDKKEGKELSEKFNQMGWRTLFVCHETSEKERELAIQRLEQNDDTNALDYVITVDLFNEGVDIRSVNQIIMLRPTESATVFIQQMGRGLRKRALDNSVKPYLTILDFIGNYKNNYMIMVALSGDTSMNKDRLRRHLMINDVSIPGSSIIEFDRISEEKIYNSINQIGIKEELKTQYTILQNMLGFAPDLRYLHRYDKLDPVTIIREYKTLNRLREVSKLKYYEFTDLEKRILENLCRIVISGNRPHESVALKGIIENGEISKEEFIDRIDSEFLHATEKDFESCKRVLSGSFDRFDHNMIESSDNLITANEELKRCLINKDFRTMALDAIECGLMIYSDRYHRRNDNGLVLYQKYSISDICKILNWEANMSSVVGGHFVNKEEKTGLIFVTYEKSSKISASIRYEDRFVNRGLMSWVTTHNRTIKSKDVQDLINPDVKRYLFVKKSDNEDRTFYFCGRVDPIVEQASPVTMLNDEGKEQHVVNIPLRLETPVVEELYQYLTSTSTFAISASDEQIVASQSPAESRL